MNVYDEVLHRLSSKVRIRSLFKDVHVEDMERVIQRCNEVFEEKKRELNEKKQRLEQKRKSIEEARKFLDAKGLSISDLEGLTDTAPRRRNVKKFVFEYSTASGDAVRWHGATTGRLPKEFQEFLGRTGKKRLDCVIEMQSGA